MAPAASPKKADATAIEKLTEENRRLADSNNLLKEAARLLEAEIKDLKGALESERNQLRIQLQYDAGKIKALERLVEEERAKAAKAAQVPSQKDQCLKEIGWAYVYMKYLHPSDRSNYRTQRERLKRFAMEFAVHNLRKSDDPYWEGLLERIADEFDNLC